MKKTILIVEDDDDLSGIYKEILELYGFDIQIAINGLEGVKKFKEKTIFSDYGCRYACS
ncbi:MAG: hypothetical protein V3R39_02360 [Nitrosopumilus sp.]